MSLFDQVSNDIKEAMKARESVRLEALRGLKKEFIEAKTAKSATAELSDDEALKIVQKLVKQRKDTAEIYSSQNRADLADRELEEANALSVYLPKQLSAGELEIAIKALIEESGVVSAKEMGKVMGLASKELAGKADGKAIADMVKRLLS
ncbi:MAG: GatB/YqeY domain-containing protein [Breznakibacter sp.]